MAEEKNKFSLIDLVENSKKILEKNSNEIIEINSLCESGLNEFKTYFNNKDYILTTKDYHQRNSCGSFDKKYRVHLTKFKDKENA